ncbi:helix-turn-helix domain-containing protein [Halomarina litorea]|uniref:helix-turn-helix domain-containing protein n=1 Tax=Halomarina litorea TaxID=2961595 RepID=UPI0020C3FEFA|nr:helix-turn-helix domain-containing protein [Halomarina sp. BCD28]
MREFVFTVEYDAGVDRLADAFIDHPDAMGASLACCVTARNMWRLDRLTGSPAALDAVEACFLDGRCNECIGHEDCGATCQYEVLRRTPGSLTVYTFRPEVEHCHSIPYLATSHLGDGLLFETTRTGDRYEWRVLLRDGDSVGGLYDALQSDLRPGVRLNLTHLGTPDHWCERAVTVADLPAEQREALIAAVDGGYYRTPREATVADLADSLGVPRSTLQYRLQRAEAWLARAFVDATR